MTAPLTPTEFPFSSIEPNGETAKRTLSDAEWRRLAAGMKFWHESWNRLAEAREARRWKRRRPQTAKNAAPGNDAVENGRDG